MHGLTVRWSLENAPEGVEEALAGAQVQDLAHAHGGVVRGLLRLRDPGGA